MKNLVLCFIFNSNNLSNGLFHVINTFLFRWYPQSIFNFVESSRTVDEIIVYFWIYQTHCLSNYPVSLVCFTI